VEISFNFHLLVLEKNQKITIIKIKSMAPQILNIDVDDEKYGSSDFIITSFSFYDDYNF